jgi:hypothetical protein
MPITITGDMTEADVDQAMVDDLYALVASNASSNMISISHRQAERLLELLAAAGGPGKSQGQGQGQGPGKPKAGPQARAAAVDEDDEDEKPKPKRR